MQSAQTLLNQLAQGEVTAETLVQGCLDRIQKQDSTIGAFLSLSENALDQAREIDRRRAKGEKLGPLAGLPIALKDNLCTKGELTTAASKILSEFRPVYSATVVEKLIAADAIILGKTNLDEFAMGSSTENSAFIVTRNPHDPSRIAGGSSGGSAAAVAADFAPLSLGSDTGGSIRQPAALCGVVGLKPSYGRVSRYGLIAFGSSLDQVGPFGNTVEDVALLLEVIAGHDPRDATSGEAPVAAYSRLLEMSEPPTIGVPKEFFGEGLDGEVEKAVREALEVYRRRGAKVREISLPHSKYALATYYLVATAEASSNLARYDGVHFGGRAAKHEGLIDMMSSTRGEKFGPEVKRRIMLGTYALSSGYRDAYYLKALQVRRLIKEDFDKAFAQCDVVIGPTTPTAAFKVGEKASDPLAMYLADIYTISANLAGLPAISIPCGRTKDGLPIGLHLQGRHLEEEKLLRIAKFYEDEKN